ncbi:hypothetical protein [Runella sp.]|uniref:hypothetical protein n=1 Tax=Runella sp. TaxID=1960881 RepID=UPI003D120718
MKVKIAKAEDGRPVKATIKVSNSVSLPSLTEGWKFNFRKHSKKAHFETYILVCDETPAVIEGCLIFQLKGAVEPYMAYIEIAPHNKGSDKIHVKVAECLIAFACRLSFIKGKEHYKGWLAFDVLEEDKQNEIILMTLYSQKYGALKFGETTMVIPPEAGEKLVAQFLNT